MVHILWLPCKSVTLARICPDSLGCVLVAGVLALGVARSRVSVADAVFTICSLTALYVVFTQAERLKPEGWKENRLFLAKCYIGQWIK